MRMTTVPRRALGIGVALTSLLLATSCTTRATALAPVPPPPPTTTVPKGVLVGPTGVVMPILQTFDGGWWVRTPCFGLRAVHDGRVVERADVVIEPGHGGPEKGAVGPTGLEEREPNAAIATLVADELERSGLRVQRTHGGTSYVTLHTRGEVAVALQPDAFVSIHHNAVGPEPRKGAPSTDSFFQFRSAASRELAQALQDDVSAALAKYDIAWRSDDSPRPKYRIGDHGDYYGILRYSAGVPAAILEVSFIDNAPEEALQRTDEYRQTAAHAIAGAIQRFVQANRERRAAGVVAPAPEMGEIPVGLVLPPEGAPEPDDSIGCVDPSFDRPGG